MTPILIAIAVLIGCAVVLLLIRRGTTPPAVCTFFRDGPVEDSQPRSWWDSPAPPEIRELKNFEERGLIVHCLFYWKTDPETVVAALRDFPTYLAEKLREAMSKSEEGIRLYRHILAAGLLTYGNLEMVDVILDNMPEGVLPGHATGYCVAAGSFVLSRLLPLPAELQSSFRTVVDEPSVRRWFDHARHSLEWNEERHVFQLR